MMHSSPIKNQISGFIVKKEDKIFIKGELVFSANDANENLADEADKQFWRQCKCGQGQFLVPLTTDGAISRPVKSRIGKGQP